MPADLAGIRSAKSRYTVHVVIRPQQLEALSQAMIGDFEVRMATMTKLRYPQKTNSLTQLELRAIIHSGVNRARQYGIDLTGDVETFIRLMFRFRIFNFEEDPPTAWTREVLMDGTLTAEEKLEQVEGQASLFQLIAEEEN